MFKNKKKFTSKDLDKALKNRPVHTKPQIPKFHCIENDQAVLTARSLLLDQEVSIMPLRSGASPFNYGSLTHSLGLLPADLFDFKGKRVLDLAGGASILAEELVTAFGADGVYVVDNDADLESRMAEKTTITGTKMTNRKAIGKIYKENMKTLKDIVPKSTEWEDVHTALLENASATAAAYFKSDKVIRMVGDATDMTDILDLPDCVDVTINSWMLMYLDKAGRKKALKEMVRVTRPGGIIFIQGGSETAVKGKKTGKSKTGNGDIPAVSVKKFEAWFKEYKKGDDTFVFENLGMAKTKKATKITKKTVKLIEKRVKIDKKRSKDSLLVLEVV